MDELEQIKELLNNENIDKDAVISKVESFATDLKTKLRHKDSENLKIKNALKSMGYDKNEHNDLDTFVSHISDLKSKTLNNTDASAKIQLLESKIKEYETKETNWKYQQETSNIKDKLQNELSGKLKGSDTIIENLLLRKELKLVDNDVVFVSGDEVESFEKGIEKLLKKHQDLLINPSKEGNRTNNRINTNKSNLTLEGINKLNRDEALEKISEIKKLAKFNR